MLLISFNVRIKHDWTKSFSYLYILHVIFSYMMNTYVLFDITKTNQWNYCLGCSGILCALVVAMDSEYYGKVILAIVYNDYEKHSFLLLTFVLSRATDFDAEWN